MNTDRKARDLFIVDNSISGWTGLRYLEEWAGIAKGFDVATGYFEIGSLLALDGKWQTLDKIRILMGGEITFRTRKLMLDAVKAVALANLDASMEAEKDVNPFLRSVPAILAALKSGQIECRVYDKNKFHAKAYITHAKLEVIGSQALVGSSNFTRPGLTQNIELNVQIQSAREVGQLQEWFESHWNEATNVTESVIETVARQIRPYTPFDVYAKALHEFFRGHELTESEWEQGRSLMFGKLDYYQKEAYWALMKIASQHRGAFLCDGVGLGKTFVGLMLIERLVLREGKRVVLFAPKAAKESVWEPHLRAYLSHIGGIGGSADFSNLAVFSHTDLGRAGEFPERFSRIAQLADAVIIDEAHHFRNPGSKRETSEGEPSRYYKLYDLLDDAERPKSLYMLTATPINNRISDFRHMAELFTRRDEDFFGRTLGVHSLTAHFNKLEKDLRAKVGGEAADLTERLPEAQELLSADEIFRHLVVQRSRAYARESQIGETGKSAVFPERTAPQVAEYSFKKTYERLLDMMEQAFQKAKPLFSLSIYYPLAYYKGPDTSIDPLEMGRQVQVVSLIRTQFLKRFESSVSAFELSCDRLMKKLIAFVQVHSESAAEKNRLERWKNQNAEILGYVAHRQLEIWNTEDQDDPDEDVVPQEFLDAVEELDPAEYKVSDMIQETFLDLDQIVKFLEEARKFEPRNDDKLQKLIRLLKSNELAGQKVLIFTEFADTARYLLRQLRQAGIEGVAQIDSATKGHRDSIIRRFSPYYNGRTSEALKASGEEEIRILISTDVLSEGLNLQDASRMINYDIHWNPVRLMQRIGRVDRRMNPEIETQLVHDHPEVKESRGKVSFWNFLPPAELNKLLTLFTTVARKTLLISKTFGIEGKKLLTPKDDYDALKEFNHSYEGTKTAIERMRLEYQDLIKDDPDLEARLTLLPGATFSGRQCPSDGIRGVFFCYGLPALDKAVGQFTFEAGTTRWYLYDLNRATIHEEPSAIVDHIRSMPETPRKCTNEESTLIDIRAKVEKHIKNGYLKRIDAPIGVKPSLKCWMELNEG
jgi:superfamily II DNA or RNA helicase